MSLKRILLRSVLQRNKYSIHKFTPLVLQDQHFKNNYRGKWSNKKITALALFSSVVIGAAASKNEKQDQTEVKIIEAGEKRPDLPTYRAEEVSKHDNKSSFWVTYKHGVYDVTSFLPSHPGGEQILNAAGLSIEPFWNVYGMHKTQDVYKILESYRIGNLHDDDVADHSDEEMWAREPFRDPRLIVKTERPFNAEIPPDYQIQHFDTPNELFYVRQHMPVPELQADSHTLSVRVVGAGGERRCTFSLQQLQRFPRVDVRAALMCAGNRRSEMNQVKEVKGLSWGAGAISCAVWGGVRLRDVLLHCGVDPDHTDGKHVILTGADIDATGVNFSTSIPLHMALDPAADILLATHMNGAPLPADHGRPLRAVVPGAPAVRSVKWLESITVSTEESSSHWHQKDYRAFNPSKTWETADFSTAPPVYSLPVTSAVCRPAHGDTVTLRRADTHLAVAGYAYSGGGAKIVRVDVSADGGRSWREAALRADAAPPRSHHGWTLWRLDMPLHGHPNTMEIWVKATDSNFNTQPENFNDIWNIRGILSNAYHKIKINIKYS